MTNKKPKVLILFLEYGLFISDDIVVAQSISVTKNKVLWYTFTYCGPVKKSNKLLTIFEGTSFLD